MQALIAEYLEKKPIIVFSWKDELSEAEGWLVINSLTGGASGGGTRMRKGLTYEEVLALAKVMEIKFKVSGPPIGGAKSGINFDPKDPRKEEVLKRWFKAVRPILTQYYGTGGDMNIDESKEVIPICKEFGIVHPQEGVLTGHFGYKKAEKTKVLKQLQKGCLLPVITQKYSPDNGKGMFSISDLATGWGVSESIRIFNALFRKESLEGKRVIIQGWGNVASATAFYLAKQGAKIIAIQDKEGGLISEEGFSFHEIRELFLTKKGNHLQHVNMIRPEEVEQRIWSLATDIFVPAAASRLVELSQIMELKQKGLNLISCGANVPFNENIYIFGPIAKAVDSDISLIPDFIANCGMARVFAYLMEMDREISEEAIFEDISHTIEHSLRLIVSQSESLSNITLNALQNYIKK